MSFGFGIGDIIACSEVAWKTINALKSAGSDFEGLRLDLASLASVLQALEVEAKGPMPLINTASIERQDQMRLLLRNCTNSMRELQGVVGKYSGWNADKKKDFVSWMRFAAKDKRGPREKLAVHTASINIFLTTLSHGSLARLEFLIKNGSQAANQAPVKDRPKGMGFSTAKTPWGGPRLDSKREGFVWLDIGRSLHAEGITDKDINTFQAEIKAYVRYLVRGETPFWKEPFSVSRSSELPAAAELANSTTRTSNRLRQEEEEIKRLVLRDELKQARQSQRLDTEAVFELEGETRKAKVFEMEGETRKANVRDEEARMREEERRRMDDRQSKEKEGWTYKCSREEDVVSVAYAFQSLFDFDAELVQAEPRPYRHETITAPTTAAPDDDQKEDERKRRNARIGAARMGLEELLAQRDRYFHQGKMKKIADIELYDIHEQVEMLRREGMAVSREKPWLWAHSCKVCHFLIPSDDFYRCTQCREWNACQECWDNGLRCSGRGKHRIVFDGEFVS